MKRKIIALGIAAVFMAACGGNEEKKEQSAATASTASAETPMMEGERLIGESDCVGCHSRDNKIIGPSYRDIAAKYENTEENIEHLSGKILLGSKGVWGTVPMTGHPGMPQDDAKEMVRYILSLKK